MIRLRKKSDTKRSQVPEPLRAKPAEPLPSLPSLDDFRTSLILPDLTRRFSLLRSSSGSPIALDDLKSKFAEQRARGSRNQVTEEEEDMLLEALGKLHARAARAQATYSGEEADNELGSTQTESQDLGSEAPGSPKMPVSVRSASTTNSSVLHSATSNSSLSSARGSHHRRRMSNNLFGSGKSRDQAYILANQTKRSTRDKSTPSVTHSESTMSMSTIASSRIGITSIYSDNQSLRPSTPEGSTYTTSGSVPSSPNHDKAFERQRTGRPNVGYLPTDITAESAVVSSRLAKTLSPDGLKRASLALDEVIREMEEEGDDEIVMERSPIAHGPTATLNNAAATTMERGSPFPATADLEAGTALSPDDRVAQEDTERASPYPRSRTTSPTPRLPGYIPGMPRPMTPRESTFDSDDQTPSTTPRATSPRLPGTNPPHSPFVVQGLFSNIRRNNSTASISRHSPAPTTPTLASTPPLFVTRTTNGRFTPEDRTPGGSDSLISDLFDSPTQGRRHPTSPLSGPAYQSLSKTLPRPSTPSNVIWNTPSSPGGPKKNGRSGSISAHSRNDSTTSISETSADALDRSKLLTRSLRSPASPDSPWVDNGLSGEVHVPREVEQRPPSAMSVADLGSPFQTLTRPLRSPTPTYSSQKSPVSPTFADHGSTVMNGDNSNPSRRSSKQNHHSSFSLTSTHGLLLSPIANSSRSSIESAGSSYHSWDEDHRKDRLFGLFRSLDQQYSDWHDVSGLDKSVSSTPGTSPYEGIDVEDVVRKQTGLTKGDFVAIQEKLVSVSMTKAMTPDGRNRASFSRKRRPSTSQSHYSVNGTDSKSTNPSSSAQVNVTVATSRAVDHIAKASALLDSVVDSIESPQSKPQPLLDAKPPAGYGESSVDPLKSSPGRRHRALADALFGSGDREHSVNSPADTISAAAQQYNAQSEVSQMINFNGLDSSFQSDLSLSLDSVAPVSAVQSPNAAAFDVSLPSNKSPVDEARLAVEVRQKAEAATAALRKSPSIPKFGDASGTFPRKRINPSQISSPKLVSASTSVDTIPLRSPSASPGQNASTNKIGFPFRKFRGTLRAKPPLSQHHSEITPYPLNPPVPHSAPLPRVSPNAITPTEPVLTVVADPVRADTSTPSPSPPASATPGLKGFMARFRKQRAANQHTAPAPHRQRSALASIPPSTPSSQSYDHNLNVATHSAPATKMSFRSPSPSPPQSAPLQSSFSPSVDVIASEASAAPAGTPVQTDEVALRQLFDAASNLGLDQAALNDLIARSPSTSSRSTAWTKLTRMTSVTDSRKSHLHSIRISETPDGDPRAVGGRPSVDSASRPSAEFIEQPVRRVPEAIPRPPRENATDPSLNQVVRRTIIYPSDAKPGNMDLNAFMRKQRRQSASANSVHSARSIHERVPTPPPPHKFVGGRRFSADRSPPVPQLPRAFTPHGDDIPPPALMEQTSSATDSLYEMYGSDSRAVNLSNPDPQDAAGSQQAQAGTISESGQALEVIEMANGDTIWSIVNGLRDNDGESFYGDRASFVSEYSQKESNSEGLKLFFKGHEKKSSKGSNVSFSNRKRPQFPKGSVRPETKVFFSSSAQIGRLIENLSHGVDAGSFNIAPERAQAHLGHSASSSFGSEADLRWTVEERLEHMLGSISAASAGDL